MANSPLNKLGKILRSNALTNSTSTEVVSINQLRQKRINEEHLSQEQNLALKRFEKYRKTYLDAAQSQSDFENRYKQIVTLSRYTNFAEFLLDKYTT